MRGRGVEHPLWRFLASVRLLIGLLIFFVLLCAIGAVVPQELKPEELVSRYGSVRAAWLQQLHFTEIFHSGWIAFVLMGLSINVTACTLRRLRLKLMRGIRLAGYLLLHIALLIIFLGGTITTLGQKKGFLQVWEGRTSNHYWSWKDSAFEPLPFTVALDRFSIERYPEYSAPTLFVLLPEESTTAQFPADLKQTFAVGRGHYHVTLLRFLPDFSLDLETGRAFSRSEEPNNPALLVEISGPQGTERRWLLSRAPELQMGEDPRLKLLFQWQPLRVKQFHSDVRLLESIAANTPVAQEIRRATVAVNHPLRYKGWTLYQTSFDPQEHRWSGFQISNDPGVGIVYTGFVLLVVGVVTLLGVGPLLHVRTDG